MNWCKNHHAKIENYLYDHVLFIFLQTEAVKYEN